MGARKLRRRVQVAKSVENNKAARKKGRGRREKSSREVDEKIQASCKLFSWYGWGRANDYASSVRVGAWTVEI